MNDSVYLLGGLAFIAVAVVIIEATNSWHILFEAFGKKARVEKKNSQSPQPKGTRIFFDHPKLGRVPYFGKIEHPDNAFSLLDKQAKPITTLKYDQLRLKYLKPILEDGNTASLIFDVEDENYAQRLRQEIQARDMHITSLSNQIKSLTKNYEEIGVAHKKAENAMHKALWKDRRPQYNPMGLGNRHVRNVMPPMEGGEGGGEE